MQYFDEMSSAPGRMMLRDVLGTEGHASAGKCDGFLRQQIEAIRARALARGEQPVPADLIIRIVIAPLMYRMLFANEAPAAQAIQDLAAQLFDTASAPR